MGIPIEKSFVVKAPAADVWAFLTDPYRVAGCLPGAAITGRGEDGSWGGTITVKVGPVTASYRGKLRFERLDEAAREAEIAASGQETRGKGGADMRMKSRVAERSPGEAEVVVVSDVNVVGILAQFGRGMIQDVSDQLFQKFAAAMRKELEGGAAGGAQPPQPAQAAAQVPGAAAPGAAPTVTEAATTAQAASPTRVAAVAPAPSPAQATSPAPAAAVAPPAAESHVTAAPLPNAPPPLAAPPAPAATQSGENVLDLGSVGAAAAGRAAARLLRRPAFWIVAAAAALLAYWLIYH
jgi:carbon monoxide dehydrogenase subunit G